MDRGGGGPAEPVPYRSSELADNVKTREELAVRALAFSAKGGEVAEPVAERHPHLNPSEWTTNMTKAWAGSRTTLVVSKVEKKGNTRASARIKVLFTHCPIALLPRKLAFTMAEILLSLTIIGVVAAITLPSLTGNINERTWNTQRKALYARFSQAIALMPALNGYGTLMEATSSTSAVDTAAETFVTDGLAKVLKINNICDNEHLNDCGLPSSIQPLGNGSAISLENIKVLSSYNPGFSDSTYNIKSAAFETANGESILVYYNPNCVGDLVNNDYVQSHMCANFVYDLNGSKGPNTMGKDIGFISAINPVDPIAVAPIPLAKDAQYGTFTQAISNCRKQDAESRLPNREEIASMFYNRALLGLTNGYYWSSTSYSRDKAWFQYFATGYRYPSEKSFGESVRCIKR